MGLSEDEKRANDMTKSGFICPSPTCTGKEEMEKVSGVPRLTCHYCGGTVEVNEKGEIIETWFIGH